MWLRAHGGPASSFSRSVIECDSKLFSLVQFAREKRVFDVPFIFPTTGTGHVPCYCCLVPNGKFVQCFMQPKRCRLACQGQVKQISLESNACGAVHVSWCDSELQNVIASGWSRQKEWFFPSGWQVLVSFLVGMFSFSQSWIHQID